MKLNDNYRILSDDMNVILQKKYLKKDGVTEEWKSVKWYGNLKEALLGFTKLEILGTGMEDFKTIVAKMEELEETIKNMEVK